MSGNGAFADTPAQILPPVDVTELDPVEEPIGNAGRVRIDSLNASKKHSPSAADENRKASDKLPGPAAATAPFQVPGKMAVSEQKATEKKGDRKDGLTKPVLLSSGPVRFSAHRVSLVSGQDETESAVISIPAIEEVPPQPDPAVPTPSADSPEIEDSYQVWTQPVGKTSPKKLARKQKREQRRAQPVRKFGLLEFYDPDFERLDVDDYDRQIVLTSEAIETPAVGDEVMSEESEPKKLFERRITDIKPTLDFAWGNIKPGSLPPNFHADEMDKEAYVDPVVPRMVLQWEPTNLWYHPVYFEDIGLERYGHSHRPLLQPLASTGKFFGQVATLPYQMALRPPTSREFALGYYQPGEWAPKKKYQLPFNEEASTVEFLWITGLVLLIP